MKTRGKVSPANQLTKDIIQYLNGSGFLVWRNNNNAVYDANKNIFRKNPTTKLGVCDIVGLRKKDAKFIGVEVKYGKDKLSIHQIYHHEELRECGAIVIVAHNIDQFINDLNKQTK